MVSLDLKTQDFLPSSLILSQTGATIETEIASSNPLSFKIVQLAQAHGHAKEIYKWYLPDSGWNLLLGSLETISLNSEV